VSAATGILRAPALDYGVHQTGDPSCPGIASLSRKTLHRAINELIASWETVAKVRKIIILTAHAAEAHQEALSTIRTIGEVNLVDIFDLDFSAEVSPPVGTVNGGIIATSILLHLAPTVVAPPPFSGATPELGERLYRRVRDRVIDRLR
jgi:creatinine amidohydrolase